MFDSITAADIPSGSQLVAGYVDGRYRWSDADWAFHSGKVLVRIAVDPNTSDGHVLDVETGAAGPQDAPFWAHRRRAAGADPTCYVNLSNWQATRDAFTTANEPEPHWWLALYDNVPSIPVGAVAKQYADAAMTGAHYDASVVEDFWPGVDGGEMDQFVTKVDFEAYKVALQKELDENYVRRDQLPAPTVPPHGHTGAVSVS